MLRATLLALALSSACSHAPPPSPDDAEPASNPNRVEEAALALAQQLKSCDKATVLARSISYEDLQAVTDNSMDKATYDREVGMVLDGLCKHLANPSLRIYSVKPAKIERVPVSDKIKMPIQYATVRIVVEEAGAVHPGPILVFIDKGAGWQFSPKK
jgi:hypothetical protein